MGAIGSLAPFSSRTRACPNGKTVDGNAVDDTPATVAVDLSRATPAVDAPSHSGASIACRATPRSRRQPVDPTRRRNWAALGFGPGDRRHASVLRRTRVRTHCRGVAHRRSSRSHCLEQIRVRRRPANFAHKTSGCRASSSDTPPSRWRRRRFSWSRREGHWVSRARSGGHRRRALSSRR